MRDGQVVHRRIAWFAGIASMVALMAPARSVAAPALNAKFNLVIEGDTDAAKSFKLSGLAGMCEEKVEGSFEDETTFLRGRGVSIEVFRSRAHRGWRYGIRRIGGGAADFTVVAVRKRTATGSASLVPNPALEGAICPSQSEELSATPGCGKHTISRDDVGLKMVGSESFTVRAASRERASPLPKPTCGETDLTDGLLELFYEFPHFVDVAPEPLPWAKMFGRAGAVVVKLLGKSPAGGRGEPIGTAPLTGLAFDSGKSDITVRFIRCGEAGRAAC